MLAFNKIDKGISMSLFEKILVPLDGSAHSLHALEKALQIAKKFEEKIRSFLAPAMQQAVSQLSSRTRFEISLVAMLL